MAAQPTGGSKRKVSSDAGADSPVVQKRPKSVNAPGYDVSPQHRPGVKDMENLKPGGKLRIILPHRKERHHRKAPDAKKRGRLKERTVVSQSNVSIVTEVPKRCQATVAMAAATGVNGTAHATVVDRKTKPRAMVPPSADETTSVMKPHEASVSSLTVSMKNCQLKEQQICHNEWNTCEPYSKEIMNYYQTLEKRFSIRRNFMRDSRCLVSEHVRSTLADWMIQVQEHMNLLQISLHLSIAMVDWFLAHQRIAEDRIQLVGIACLLIATKYEQRISLSAAHLVYLTDDSYTCAELYEMERTVLSVMKFDLSMPTPLVYVDWFLTALNDPDQQLKQERVHALTYYLLDLILIDACFSSDPASLKAAAAVVISCRLLHVRPTVAVSCGGPVCVELDSCMYVLDGFSSDDFQHCQHRLLCALSNNHDVECQAARVKFAKEKYLNISNCPEITARVPRLLQTMSRQLQH